MAEPIFYRCNKCGNLVLVVNKGTCTPQCCGEPMEELKANTTDAATEKHVPAIQRTSQRARMRNTFSFFFMRIPPYLLMRTRGSTMP